MCGDVRQKTDGRWYLMKNLKALSCNARPSAEGQSNNFVRWPISTVRCS